MKKLLLIFFVLSSFLAYSQDLPSEPANGFSFPIGSKFTIKLHPIDTLNFDFSVIQFEEFQDVVDDWEYDYLFTDKGEENTIEFYFCLGTHGKTEKEKKKNMKVLLLMKNYSKYALKYSSDILRTEDGEFETTSNVGCFPGAKGSERWPYMIYAIGLSDFQKMR